MRSGSKIKLEFGMLNTRDQRLRREREETGLFGRKFQSTVHAWQSLNQLQRQIWICPWCLYAAATLFPLN